MYKAWIAGAVIALGFTGPSGADSSRVALLLKEERISLEYAASDDEAALVVSAESEVGLDRVQVQDPSGSTILEMQASDGGDLGLFGFVAEKGEDSPARFFETFPEGLYRIRARTVEGDLAVGTVRFAHALPQAPALIYPFEGAIDVPTTNLTLSWVPDPAVVSYRVGLEQGETDLMSARLGGGSGSFRVPDGMLAAHTRYWVEIAATGPNGNVTLVKIPFMTM